VAPVDRYDSLFQYYAGVYDPGIVLPFWGILKAQAKAESFEKGDFNPDAVSIVGAKGLAQFMDTTWQEWRDGTPGIQPVPNPSKFNPFNPEQCIRAQAAYMSWLMKQLDKDIAYALMAYNWGVGNVQKYRINAISSLPQETKGYVTRIFGYLNASIPMHIH